MTSSLSLQRKLPILITTVISAVVLATSLLAYRQIEDALLAAAGSSLRDGTTELAEIIEGTAWTLRSRAGPVAGDSAVIARLGAGGESAQGAAKAVLATLMQETPQITSASLTDRDGRSVLTLGRNPGRAALVAAVNRRDVSSFFGADSGVRFYLARPVRRSGGDTVGYLVVERTLLREAAERLVAVVGPDATLRLGDSSWGAWYPLRGSASAPPQRDLGSAPQAYESASGRTIGLVVPVESTPWLLAVEMPRATAIAGIRPFLFNTAAFAIVAVLLGGLAAWLLSREVTGPLAEMTRAAEDFARGNYGRRVSVSRNDEMGSLAASLNAMAAQIARSSADLAKRARELEEANRDLRDSEEKYRHLVTAAHEGICTVDPRGTITYANARMGGMFGFGVEELVGRSIFDLMHPDAVFEARTNFVRRVRGIAETRETEFRRRDGTALWASTAMSSLYDAAGVFTKALYILSDVSERRAAQESVRSSERHFRALIEHASDMICVIDESGRFVYASPAQEPHIGFRPGDLTGRQALDFVHPDDVASASAVLALAHASPGEPLRAQFRHRHKQGGWRELTATVTNLLADPDVRGIIVNSYDVTTQRSLERQLLQAQKMEAVGQLASGVAHDFNNLLTVVSTSAELLMMDLPAVGAASDDARAIIDAAGRGAALTRQLLAFSRRQVLQPKVIDLGIVVADLHPMLRRVLREDITLALDLRASDGRVYADPVQLEQVLVNLTVNARDAMPHGGQLTIATDCVEINRDPGSRRADLRPRHYVRLTVSDTGSGMDEATMARIFEPFFTTKRDQGSGLGLATVYGIVSQSDGHVTVDSEAGRGTTFTIHLPACTGQPSVATAAPPGEPMQRGSARILLVEDEDSVRSVARRILELAGYTVIEACSGMEAIAHVEANDTPIDLLLTDMIMPGISGRELATHLRRLRPGIRTAFMSGYTEDSVLRSGAGENPESFIQKPFTARTLTDKVRAAIGRPNPAAPVPTAIAAEPAAQGV